MPSELKKPEPVGHLHSNGDYCSERQAMPPEWPAPLYTAAQLEQYAADRVREAEEAIADEYAMRLQADLEHGVRSINEAAADTFQRVYPQLAGFMGWLNDRTLKEQTK